MEKEMMPRLRPKACLVMKQKWGVFGILGVMYLVFVFLTGVFLCYRDAAGFDPIRK